MVLNNLEGYQLNMLQVMGQEYINIATKEIADMYQIDSCEHHVYALDVVEQPVAKNIWEACHKRAHGHRGAKRTYIEMGRRFPDVKIPMDVIQQMVDACAICQKYKSDLFSALKTARHVLTAEHHRSQISVDVAGMEEDAYGNDTCFIIVNHNTKLVYLYAAKGKDERNTINAVLSYIGIYGLMERIVSDPGGEFSGQFTKKLMQKLGVNWNLSITDRPQSHGTERTVGRAVEAVRIMLAQDQQEADNLAWSEPAVLSTTSYLLNSEVNEETGYAAFDLVFGKGDCKELPDISGITGKPKLQEYMDALQRHLEEMRTLANTRRLNRQQQRLTAGAPPGNHEYQANDLVFIHDDAPLRARKFIARQLGPYMVVSQSADAAVTVRSLVDNTTMIRHHNRLRIFEGTLDEATKMARLDKNESLIVCIDGFRGNVYQRAQTEWHVIWHNDTESWERYKVVENCKALTEYADQIHYLKHRYGQNGIEFKQWARDINRLTQEELMANKHIFYPACDPLLGEPFALSIQFWNQNNELQDTEQMVRFDPPSTRRILAVQKLKNANYRCYLTAYVVKLTKAKVDVFVPALSAQARYRKFPAKNAYVKSMAPSEILQFAIRTPRDEFTQADELIKDTNFRQLVWPEHWEPVAKVIAEAARPLKEVEQQVEEDELDEGLEDGDRTGQTAFLQTRGTTYNMTIGKQFPDGDYLCVFAVTGNTIKVPAHRLKREVDRVILRRKR